jgi:hypothetical protein
VEWVQKNKIKSHINTMQAKSIQSVSPGKLKTALYQAITNGFKPTLAIVFISIKQDRKAVLEILNEQNIDVIGATSSGEFINGHQSDGEIAILLLDIKKEYYSLLFNDTNEKDIVTAAKETVETALSTFSNPAFILCSTCISEKGKQYEGDKLIHIIKDTAGNKALIFGGMAGADGMLNSTYVFNATHSTDEGFVMLVLNNDKIDVHGMALSGWKPLGRIRTVTKCEDGWLYAIDEQPALDMYLRYLGQSMQSGNEIKNVSFFEEIGFYYPLLSIDAGEPSLRTPMEVSKERNAIKLDFPIAEGKNLQFTVPPDFDIVETILQNASELKKEKHAEADALLIFSCLGRRSALGPMVQEENEGLYKIWNAPMAGFYTYGEYGKDLNSENVFHSTTCSWVALKEK